jgi:hypothetical protein
MSGYQVFFLVFAFRQVEHAISYYLNIEIIRYINYLVELKYD